MKALKVLAVIALVLGALYGLGRLFVGELGGAGAGAGAPAGVLFAAPPGFAVIDAGEVPPRAAARQLAALLVARPRESRLGLHLAGGGAERYWLVERRGAGSTVLTELLAGAGGTRVETTWDDSPATLERRLAWAAEHGTLDAPDLPGGTSHNLYH